MDVGGVHVPAVGGGGLRRRGHHDRRGTSEEAHHPGRDRHVGPDLGFVGQRQHRRRSARHPRQARRRQGTCPLGITTSAHRCSRRSCVWRQRAGRGAMVGTTADSPASMTGASARVRNLHPPSGQLPVQLHRRLPDAVAVVVSEYLQDPQVRRRVLTGGDGGRRLGGRSSRTAGAGWRTGGQLTAAASPPPGRASSSLTSSAKLSSGHQDAAGLDEHRLLTRGEASGLVAQPGSGRPRPPGTRRPT